MENNKLPNYDDVNIAGLKKAWADEKASDKNERKVYTMIQRNALCEVKITKESRKSCVEALLR